MVNATVLLSTGGQNVNLLNIYGDREGLTIYSPPHQRSGLTPPYPNVLTLTDRQPPHNFGLLRFTSPM